MVRPSWIVTHGKVGDCGSLGSSGAAGWSLSDDEMARLDQASAPPPSYPYDMHRFFTGERNPPLALQPALPAA